jgi:hypothetical protein
MPRDGLGRGRPLAFVGVLRVLKKPICCSLCLAIFAWFAGVAVVPIFIPVSEMITYYLHKSFKRLKSHEKFSLLRAEKKSSEEAFGEGYWSEE